MPAQDTITHGYPTEEPCEVCNRVDGNAVEPRFSSVTCRTHRNVPPAYLSEAKDQFAETGRTQWDAADPSPADGVTP